MEAHHLRTTRLIGIDLEIGSSVQGASDPLYAVSVLEKTNDTPSSLRNQRFEQVLQLASGSALLIIDSLSELPIESTKLPSFVRAIHPSKIVIATLLPDGTYRGLKELADIHEIPVVQKTDSEETFRLLVKLVQLGVGSVLELTEENTIKIMGLRHAGILENLPEEARFREERGVRFKYAQKSSLVEQFDMLIKSEYIERAIMAIEFGKEAEVYQVVMPDGSQAVVKGFRPYGSQARKLKKEQKTANPWSTAESMAKKEFRLLSILSSRGIEVPRPIFQIGPFVGMEQLIYSQTDQILAPQLGKINLKALGLSPIECFEELLDILFQMFYDANVVHGDFSPANVLVTETGLYIIDVRQAEMFDTKYWGRTANKIRIDKAVSILEKDIMTITKHFASKYRLKPDIVTIIEEFGEAIPNALRVS